MKPEPTPAKAAAVREMSADNWRRRRKVMFAALGFIAANLQYLIIWGKPDSLRETIAIGLVGAGVGIIGSYVFGAVWDDSNRRKALTQLVAEENAAQDGEE